MERKDKLTRSVLFNLAIVLTILIVVVVMMILNSDPRVHEIDEIEEIDRSIFADNEDGVVCVIEDMIFYGGDKI